MSGLTMTCVGVCKGDPKWRDPDTGLCCTLCGGSGKVTTYNEREQAAEEWERLKASQAARVDKRARQQEQRSPDVHRD